jgi:AraC family transcriptional regulator of adaptative response/methylated-DNA-[protein]-cysteine methyltransferase
MSDTLPRPAASQAFAVEAACRAIEAAEESPSLEDLAEVAGLSPWHFHRVFKAATGVTPKAYADQVKARRVQERLAAAGTVTEAVFDAGYGSGGRFYEAAPARLGMTPTAWRNGGRDVAIRFAVAETSLGALLVAATERGICAIRLGDDPDALVRGLQDRFCHAELAGDDPDFDSLVAEVAGLVETPGRSVDLPLDVRGTAFQEAVWRALRAIPPGTTTTYSALAAAVGRPGAVRAVGAACGANPVAVAVPCHRVVRTDGDLTGYRWGVDRKRELLRREGVVDRKAARR